MLLWGAYSLDSPCHSSLPVTLTLSLLCLPPSVPACWRTTYCSIDACTFDSFPFPSRRISGSRTFLTNAATMCKLPLDPRSRCNYTTCYYTWTCNSIQYRAPLQYLFLAQPSTECKHIRGLRLSLFFEDVDNFGVFKLKYNRTHLWHILLGVQAKLV